MSGEVAEASPASTDQYDVVVKIGVVRNGQALISLYADEPVAHDLQIVAIGPDGSPCGTWAMRLGPADQIHPSEGNPDPRIRDGLLPMKGRSRLAPQHGPVRRFELRSKQGAPLRIDHGERYHLRELFYATPEEFSRSQVARRKGNRPLDKETQMFMTAQMAVAHADSPSLELTMTMTASYAYRATDLLRQDDARRAIELLDALISRLEALPPTDYTENAVVSLLTARWHACAASENSEGFLRSLEAIFGRIGSITANSLVFTLCYNTVRSLCVLAAYSLLQGDTERARTCFEAVREVLRAGGTRLTLNVAHLREFSATCRVAGTIGYFQDEIAQAEAAGTPLLERRMHVLRGTVADKAREFLIRPAIRSDNINELTAIISRL